MDVATLKEELIKLGIYSVPSVPGVVTPGKPKKNKQETAMYANPIEVYNNTTANPDPLEVQQRKYLKNRAYDIYYAKQKDIDIEYGLSDEDYPATVEELVERIKAGRYTEKEDAPDYWSPIEQIRWRDPAKKTDRTGAAKAKKELRKEFWLMGDTVMTSKLEDAVAAVQKWEAAMV